MTPVHQMEARPRAVLMSFLLVASTGVISGCATTSQDTYKPVAGMNGIEKKQSSANVNTTTNMLLDFLLSWGLGSIH